MEVSSKGELQLNIVSEYLKRLYKDGAKENITALNYEIDHIL